MSDTTCKCTDSQLVYMLLPDGAEWEDMIIILNKEEAIEASKKYYKRRVEIFKKRESGVGYEPSYNYYKNGEFVMGA